MIWPSRILLVSSVLLIIPSVPMLGFLILISIATSGDAIDREKAITYLQAFGMAFAFLGAAIAFIVLNWFAVLAAFLSSSMYRTAKDKIVGLSLMTAATVLNIWVISTLHLFPYEYVANWFSRF